MLAGRYVETGVLIAFLLLIGFCTRIDPALAQAEDACHGQLINISQADVRQRIIPGKGEVP